MPRPLPPSDTEKIEEVYIDETSQTGHRFLVIGGIVIPQLFSEKFEQDILAARHPDLLAERPGADKLRQIGWKAVGNGDFEKYKKVIDAYFSFARKHLTSSLDSVEFHCSVVDTHVKGRAYSGKRGKIGFNREIYFHCMSAQSQEKVVSRLS